MGKESIVVIGGGIVGLSVALALSKRLPPGKKLLVLEKDENVALHQSGRNSGVLHCGLHYRPGSLKARLAVEGIRRMIAFCNENSIAYEQCGKLIVATTCEENERLHELQQKGSSNGLRGLRRLSRDEMIEREPEVGGISGLEVPEEGIVDYPAVCRAMAEKLRKAGHEVRTLSPVIGIEREENRHWVLKTPNEEIGASYFVNCAGLYSDRIAKMARVEDANIRIIPFRGEYYLIRPQRSHLVRHLIYPAPDPRFPFLGVHCTRMINGGIEVGPNAVLALAREGYRKRDVRLGDAWDTLSFSGLRKFLRKYPSMCLDEWKQSFSKRKFAEAVSKLIPDLKHEDLIPGPAGVRAQAMRADGSLVEDFEFREQENALHVLNAPSPAATASLAIGEYVVQGLPRL